MNQQAFGVRDLSPLEKLRDDIDGIDGRILSLLSERQEVASEIGRWKRSLGIEIFDPAREQEVLRRLISGNQGPLSPDSVRSIFSEIISAARSVQQTGPFAYLGPQGSFSKVGIIGGKGRMGAWFAGLLEEHGLEVVCAGQSTRLSSRDMVRQCRTIVVSVPIAATFQVIRDIGPLVPRDGLLMDLTSIKKAPVEAMLRYSRSQVVGLHPLFGPASESTDMGIVVCPGRGQEGRAWITGIFRKSGIRVVSLEPEAHDRMMGLIQGVNHFSTLALALCIKDSGYGMNELFQCSTGTFRKRLDRISAMLDQPPGLFGSLLMDNPFTGDFIETYLASCSRLKRICSHGDQRAFEELLESLNGFFGKEERES